MGRRSNKQRDTSDIASVDTLLGFPAVAPLTPSPAPLLTPFADIGSDPLTEIEDRRTFHPEGEARSARSLSGAANHRLMAPLHHASFQIGFEKPKQVLVCVRRKTRREVLFAKKKGNGGARKRRNYYSGIKC